MPCADPDPHRTEREIQARLDKVTRMLCDLCTNLDTLDYGIAETCRMPINGLSEWWEAHKQRDKIRVIHEENMRKREEVKKTALSKLTWEERQTLGLG